VSHYLFNFTKRGAAKGKTLREQAGELLQAKMWGVGAKTPNRLSLAPGDRVLVYVGAPEYEFVGHAELASSTHAWTAEEAAQYPGSFDGGVTFQEAALWAHPVAMKNVLAQLPLSKTNPNAQFFSGVVRVTKEDYETIVAVGTGKSSLPKPAEPAVVGPSPGPSLPRRRGVNGKAAAAGGRRQIAQLTARGRLTQTCCSKRLRS
jgi:hypothetical protein